MRSYTGRTDFSTTRRLSQNIQGHKRIASIERLITSENFQEARHQSHELIKTTLGGLRYLETYDRTLIRIIVTLAYTGWIAFSAVFVLAPSRPPPAGSVPFWIPLLFGLAAIGSCGLFVVQRLPWTFHIYIIFPFYFWQDVTRKVYANWSALRGHGFNDVKWTLSFLLRLSLAVVALQHMVVRHISPFSSL
jgi:phosphatidylinositol glycan class N